jgi:small subunit ribosomal protein S20
MPVIKSAIKAMKQNNTARERNRITKADFRGKVKLVRKDIETSGKDAEKLLAGAIQAIDKAAKKGVIHKKAAARRKSRLMLAVNKVNGKPVVTKAIKIKGEKPVVKTPAKKTSVKKMAPIKKPATTKKTTTKKEA